MTAPGYQLDRPAALVAGGKIAVLVGPGWIFTQFGFNQADFLKDGGEVDLRQRAQAAKSIADGYPLRGFLKMLRRY